MRKRNEHMKFDRIQIVGIKWYAENCARVQRNSLCILCLFVYPIILLLFMMDRLGSNRIIDVSLVTVSVYSILLPLFDDDVFFSFFPPRIIYLSTFTLLPKWSFRNETKTYCCAYLFCAN